MWRMKKKGKTKRYKICKVVVRDQFITIVPLEGIINCKVLEIQNNSGNRRKFWRSVNNNITNFLYKVKLMRDILNSIKSRLNQNRRKFKPFHKIILTNITHHQEGTKFSKNILMNLRSKSHKKFKIKINYKQYQRKSPILK